LEVHLKGDDAHGSLLEPLAAERNCRAGLAVPAGGGLLTKFGRFLLVGGFCTLLQYCVLVILVREAQLAPTAASTLGYALSALVNYLLSHSFTFASTSSHGRALPRFVLITALGLALNAAVMIGLTSTGAHYLLAQVVATGVTLAWNFLANLRWTF
jgi:putative flippase GtrA